MTKAEQLREIWNGHGDVLGIDKAAAHVMECMNVLKGNTPTAQTRESVKTGWVKFTIADVMQMPQAFRKIMCKERRSVYLTRRPIGEETVYTISYPYNGYDLRVEAKDLETAKKDFIAAVNATEAAA